MYGIAMSWEVKVRTGSLYDFVSFGKVKKRAFFRYLK
jgi:hypothetical protein